MKKAVMLVWVVLILATSTVSALDGYALGYLDGFEDSWDDRSEDYNNLSKLREGEDQRISSSLMQCTSQSYC